MAQPTLKGVLFDLDDTLIDWSGFEGDWHEIEKESLKNVYDFLIAQNRALDISFNGFVAAFDDRVQEVWADARTSMRAPHLGSVLMEALQEFGFVPDDIINMQTCMEKYNWQAMPGVRVFPDVVKALTTFGEHGVKVGIVTNAFAPMALRDIELKTFGLWPYFERDAARVSAADIGYLKPHPIIFEHALALIGTPPDETVFVGDNPIADISGAQKAGMKTVLRVNYAAPPPLKDIVQPDAMVTNFDDLMPILDKWYPGWRS